jgi:hypothetical protein
MTIPVSVLTYHPSRQVERTKGVGERLASHGGCDIVLKGPLGASSSPHTPWIASRQPWHVNRPVFHWLRHWQS